MSEYYEPKNLEDKLTKRGYQKYALTTALGLEIDKIPLTRTNSEVEFLFMTLELRNSLTFWKNSQKELKLSRLSLMRSHKE